MRRKWQPTPAPDLQVGDVILLSKRKWLYANTGKETVFRATVLAVRQAAGIFVVDCYLAQREHLISVLPAWIEGTERQERRGGVDAF